MSGADSSDKMTTAEISVVVPMYNAGGSIDELYSRLCAALGDNCQLIFVNDCSTDDTLTRIHDIALRDLRVYPINLLKNCGQQEATLCGLGFTTGRLAATIDADLQYPPELLRSMIAQLDSDGLDIIYAVPKGAERRFAIGSKMRDLLFLLLFPESRGVKLSSYRVMRRELAERVIARRRGFNYFSAIVFSSPVRAASIDFPFQRRGAGKSNYSFLGRFRLFMNIFIHYSALSRLIPQKPPQKYPIEGETFS